MPCGSLAETKAITMGEIGGGDKGCLINQMQSQRGGRLRFLKRKVKTPPSQTGRVTPRIRGSQEFPRILEIEGCTFWHPMALCKFFLTEKLRKTCGRGGLKIPLCKRGVG